MADQNSQKPFQDYLKGKTVLICDPPRSLRSSIKKVMSEMGFELNNIHFQEGYKDSLDDIDRLKPDFVISAGIIQGTVIDELIKKHMKVVPNRRHALFMTIASENPWTSKYLWLDYDLDGYFEHPFTVQTMIEQLTKSLDLKSKQDPWQDNFHQAKAKYLTGDFDGVLADCETFLQDEKSDKALVYCLKGQSLRKKKELKAAAEAFESVMEYDPQNYRALQSLSDINVQLKEFSEAFLLKKTIHQYYGINPDKVPALIKLAVINKKFSDINAMYEFFITLEQQEKTLSENIAAGMAIAGKLLAKEGKTDEAVDTIVKAAEICQGNVEIVKSLCGSLISMRKINEAGQIISRFSEGDKVNPELQIMELELLSESNNNEKALASGLGMINKGIQTQKLFEIVIKTSVKMDRNKSFIEELVDKASKKYPEAAQQFSSLYKT